jgi:exonuclease SbcC
MKLKLRNFRCYESEEFDFGNDGLTLISGSSGKGKSTLMMAIEFALFGSGSKLQTYGKKSCSVELEIAPDFKIMRQKCPNRLVVNDEYEDDAGETVIRSRFGSSMLSCYIPQNIRKTFVLMSPAERLECLESLVLTNVNIQDIKAKTKSLIKKLGDEHNESIGSLRAMTETLATITKPQQVSFPLKVSKENYEKAMGNEQVKNKNSRILIKRNEKKLESLASELGDRKLLEGVLFEKQSQIQNLEKQIQNLEDYTFDNEMLLDLKKKLQQILSLKTFSEKKNLYEKNLQQLNEMKEEELRELQETISQTVVWEDMSKDEATDQLVNWKDEVSKLIRKKKLIEKSSTFENLDSTKDSLISKLEKATTDLESTKKTIAAIEFQQTIHKCPHCSNNLQFKNGNLVKVLTQHDDQSSKGNIPSLQQDVKTITTTISSLRKKLQEVEIKIRDQENISSELAELQDVNESSEEELSNLCEYIRENSEAEAILVKLQQRFESKTYSHTVVSLEGKTKLIKKELDKINALVGARDDAQDEMTEEKIRTLITEQELQKDRFERTTGQKITINLQITKINSEVLSLKSTHDKNWGQERALADIEDEISLCKSELLIQKEKYEKSTIILEKIEKYTNYVKSLQVWNKIDDQHAVLTAKEKNLRVRYSAACTFRDKILEAESIAITNTIDTINTHAQFYLDHFFVDEPITIRLVPFKETKDNQKPQINLEIEYKGIDHDLSMLSGGEMSRVVLAFTLALSEIHNTPFIMLDESTSSLDQELTSSVVDGLKENFGNKLVLLIAHQVVQGAFDTIVKL